MAVIAEITVPADTFILGQIFHTIPDAVIEFEPVVPFRSKHKPNWPLVWISHIEPAEVRTTLLEEEDIDAVDAITSTEEKTLFEIQWNDDDIDGIIQPLIEYEGRVLKATGTANEWEFHLLFDSHMALSEFNMEATNREIPVTLQKVHNSGVPNENTSSTVDKTTLQPNYRDTLLLAYRNGYYDTPRTVQLSELAQKEDISDSALSKRIRRATATLIEHTLLADSELGDTTLR
ncbi:helix-turn-helix domain-containing protein [Natrarchaeobius chitinivorans]|uniref:Bacterio-opsin activator n=1 Tax=Natrarchaeobius chitinivorans TaxID=1679083 RepID=A0A3N6M7K7_NATCH|nr:helix-turn-helix domain-containing protein [Natrarchaeobius chitinivorans]RQG96634.1 bacterio-opsin activator [Natrarchaeobius chitinivorans]